MRRPRNTPITNARRTDLLAKAAQAHRAGVPLPSQARIAEEWQTQPKVVRAYVRSLSRRGVLRTEKRGQRIYVAELRA